MTKYIRCLPNPLLDDIVKRRCIPIVGAGFSRNADLPSGLEMPLWEDIGRLLASQMTNYVYTTPIDAISTFCGKFSKAILVEQLCAILQIRVARPGPAHLAFADLPFDTVITTNFDFLLERAYDIKGRRSYPILSEDQLSINYPPPRILKIHGDLNHPKRLVITERDYDTFLENHPLIRTYITDLLLSKTPLLIGYSLDDPDLRQIWQVIGDRLSTLRRTAYILGVGVRNGDIEKYQRRGVKVIALHSEVSAYGDILEVLFEELREYWLSKTPGERIWQDILKVVYTAYQEGHLSAVQREEFAGTWKQQIDIVLRNLDHLRENLIALEVSGPALPSMKPVERLTFPVLQEVAWEISDAHGEHIRMEYDPESYLPRDQIKEAFDDFLGSEKTCFVLIGKSGVGKSNFVASIMEAMGNRPDVCVLAYDGSDFSTEAPFAKTITKDFKHRLGLKGAAERGRFEDIFYEIARIDGIESIKVLLIIDALNENANSRALLRLIDAFVRDYALTWLKVIITSRPQAWYMMKKGVTLAAQRYYRRRKTDQVGRKIDQLEVVMEPFGYIEAEVDRYFVRLREFTTEELPEAYKRYQDKYRIKTAYRDLPANLLGEIRDPIKLWRVAQMHEEKEIPPDIDISEIDKKYLDFLLGTGRLHREDLRFLEDKIMPLMISKGQPPSNAITADQIARDPDLYDSIWSEALLPTGHLRNILFVRLCAAGLLQVKGSRLDYTISFRFEIFYDYFAGKRLFQLNQSEADPEGNYRRLTEIQLKEYPFFWGAIKQALLCELNRRHKELIIELAFTGIPEQREILANALREYGKKAPADTQDILVQLIGLRRERQPAITRIREFLATKGRALTTESINAKGLALDVASTLDMGPVLEAGIRDHSEIIRAHAVRNIFYLWQRNPKAGFKLLRKLVSEFTPRTVFFNRRLLQACVEVSILILINNYKSQPAVQEMLAIWRPALKSLFSYEGPKEKWRMLRDKGRTWILGRIIKYLMRRIYSPKYHIVGNIRELAVFFHLPEEQMQRCRRLVPYLDPSHGSLSQIEEDILQAARDGDTFTAFIGARLLSSHGLRGEYEDALRLMKAVYDIGMIPDPPNLWAPGIIFDCFRLADATDVVEDRAFDLVRYMVRGFCDRRNDLHYQGHLSDSYVAAGNLASYALLYSRKYGTVKVDLLQKYASEALNEDNTDLARSYILDMEYLLMHRQWDLFQEGLSLILPFREKEIQDKIIELLGAAKLYYRNEVENFMHEASFSDEDKLRVRAIQHEESLYELAGLATNILTVDAFRMPLMKKEFIRALQKATDCRSLGEWLLLIGKRLVNMISGEEIFGLKQAW